MSHDPPLPFDHFQELSDNPQLISAAPTELDGLKLRVHGLQHDALVFPRVTPLRCVSCFL